MLTNFKKQMLWQDKYIPLVARKLGEVFIVRSSFKVDTQNATDLVMLHADKMNFAVRLRRLNNYGDRYLNQFTIRAKTKNNKKTEIDKILEGYADYGIYAWVCEKNQRIKHWTIFDFDVFRQTFNKDKLNNKHLYMNQDDSGFYSFDFKELPSNFVIQASIGEINE